MIERRAFLCGAILTLAARRAAHAQPAGKVPRVGLLVMARNPGVEDAFPRGLQDLGYVEGRSVHIEWRSADGRSDRLSPLAAELVQLGVDVIVAAGPEARVAAMKATSTIPIVVVGGADPVREGWAGSLARPGGHVTGFTMTHPEMRAKKLEFLKEMIPGLSRVGELRDGGASVAMSISASGDRRVEALGNCRIPGELRGRPRRPTPPCRKGVRAGELPVERPTKFELVINLKNRPTLWG